MVALKMAFSDSGRRMVEVFDNEGRFVAGIYPDEGINGISIVSEHIDAVMAEETAPRAVRVSFRRRS